MDNSHTGGVGSTLIHVGMDNSDRGGVGSNM